MTQEEYIKSLEHYNKRLFKMVTDLQELVRQYEVTMMSYKYENERINPSLT